MTHKERLAAANATHKLQEIKERAEEKMARFDAMTQEERQAQRG